MATIYLVRHGQASFGSADYDQLSPQGRRQCEILGEHLRSCSRLPRAIYIGSQRRHWQSAVAILGETAGDALERLSGFNEYDFHALMHNHLQGNTPPSEPRAFYRMLRGVLGFWADAKLDGAETWVAFKQRVREAALTATERARRDGDVLIVSSGGAISAWVADILQLPPQLWIELNLQMRNSAITELQVGRRAVRLGSFNSVPHLERTEYQHLISYS